MARRILRRLARDTRGAALVEFALLAFLTLLVIGGSIDCLLAYWQWNSTIKAVERGARIAAVSDPVARGIEKLNAIGSANLPGQSQRSARL